MDMTKDIFGKLYGDKGYISKAMADILWGNGIQMVTKPRKNMKGMNLSQTIPLPQVLISIKVSPAFSTWNEPLW
jgi:hypothetical protein